MIDPQLQRSYAWFRSRGHTSQAALLYARAEAEASRRGWRVAWVPDETPFDYPDCCWEDGNPCKPRRKGCGREHECYGAILYGSPVHEERIDAFDRDPQRTGREVLASLWGIWDAGCAYLREIEAELALDAVALEAETISLMIA